MSHGLHYFFPGHPPVVYRHFVVGDIVTRDGTDEQRVLSTDGDAEHHPTTITVLCTKEPKRYVDDDGSTWEPWCKLGEEEFNLSRRYSYVDPEKELEVCAALGLDPETYWPLRQAEPTS